MIFQSLLAKLGFDTSDWTKGTVQAKSDLKSLDSKTGDFFKNLRKNFGRRSLLGELTDLFAGGAIVGGLVLAGKEVMELADWWVGTKKATEAAAAAARDYAAQVKATDEAMKTAKEWELSANARLIKSYRDLDNARHPERKEKNDLANNLDDITAAIQKEKDTIGDLNQQVKESAKARDEAQKQLLDLDQKGKEGGYTDHFLFKYTSKGLREQFEKTFDDESSLVLQNGAKVAILQKQLAKDEIAANQTRLNVIATANAEAANKAADDADKAAKEKSQVMAEAARAQLELAKKTADDGRRIAKEAEEKRIADLTQERDDIRAAMHGENEKITTETYRAGDVVHVQRDPSITLEQQQLSELKKLNTQIDAMRKEADAIASSGVPIGG